MYDLLGSLIRETNFDNVDKLRTLIQGVCCGECDAYWLYQTMNPTDESELSSTYFQTCLNNTTYS